MSTGKATEFGRSIQTVLAPLANEAAAVPMRAYMRNQFPYLGIPSGPRRAATRDVLRQLKPSSSAQLLECAAVLWELPQREYQHLAVDTLAMHRKLLSTRDMPALLELARRKSWWDSVDGLASVIGDVVQAEAAGNPEAQRCMDEAVRHEDMWTRRIAMIHQVGWRLATDEARLFNYARMLAGETEFFIRKAIGWALRDYARHRPETVRAFLRTQGAELSPLSVREAAKHLGHL